MLAVYTPAGAAVRLRSGGPVMVVLAVSSDELLVCGWWSRGRTESAEFHPSTLDTLALDGPLALDE